jgi:hypothetical protein
MASLFTSGRFAGPPLGTLKTYAAGTLTPLATYTTESGATANPTTINIPASGYAAVWLGDGLAYRMIVADANGVVLYDEDNITAPDVGAAVVDTQLRTDLADSTAIDVGAGLVGFGAALAYPAGTVGAALRRFDPSLPPWNADKTGATNATAAINACAEAAGVGGRLDFSPGTYRIVGKLEKTKDHQWWDCYGAVFDFRPTANSTCLEVKSATPGASVWGGGIKGARFTSPDSTYVKTALDIVDARIHALEDIVITGTVSRSGTNFWSDDTAASVGLRIQGRELIESDRFYIAADKPVRISPSPNTSIVGIDHSTFNHFTLLAYLNSAVNIDDGVIVTQSGFTGRLSVNLARSAVKWYDTIGTTSSNGFFIEHMRAEQPESTSYPVIDIRMSGAAILQNLFIRGGFCNQAGPYLRGVQRASFDGWYHGTTAVNALNIDSTVDGVDGDNCFWQDASTVSMPGQRIVFGTPKIPNNGPLPPTFRIEPTTNTKREIIVGGAMAQAPVTLADNATLDLGANLQGILSVTTSEGFAALFVVHGSQAVSELIATTTSTAYFSNTAGTASKVNVYWDGSTYRIENKRGGSRNIKYALLGSYGTF